MNFCPNCGRALTADHHEQVAMRALIELAVATFHLLDDTEDNGETLTVQRSDFEAVSAQLDVLDSLPDDKPGYTLGPGGRAEWAMRRVLVPK